MIEVQAFYEVFANNSGSKSAHYKLQFLHRVFDVS